MMRYDFVCLAFLVAMVGCSEQQHDHSRGPLKIAKKFKGTYPIRVSATTGMVADMVSNIGGDHVKVAQLFGPGVDPHTYAPSLKDVKMLQDADIVFYSGLHLEGKMTELFESLSHRVPSVGIGDHLPAARVLKDEEGAMDPHVWFDVSLWAETAPLVAEALSQFDPAHAAEYKTKANAYRTKLLQLHTWAGERVREVPSAQRVLITSHDAFRYFGRAYEVDVRGIQGITTDTEASIAKINDLVRFIHTSKVKAVFVETSVNERTMKTLRDGCARMGHVVSIGGTLFSDAMGDPGTPEGTYEGMIRHNINTVVDALK